jgi:hypothetical protein
MGDALMVQHSVAESREPRLCRTVSVSGAITKNGRSKVKVVWEPGAKKIDEETCEYSNKIHAPTDEFLV